MPYKNDNLEELFQKAAKDYPLKTDSSNWNDVVAKLNSYATKTLSGKNKVWKYAAIVLLLAGSSIILYKFQFNSTGTGKQYQNTERSDKELNSKVPTTNKPLALSKVYNSAIPIEKKPDFTFKNFSSVKNQFKRDVIVTTHSIMNNNYIGNNNLQLLDDHSSNSGKLKNDASQNIQHGNQTGKLPVENRVVEAEKQNMTGDVEKNFLKSTAATVHLKQSFKIYGTLYGGPEFSMVKFQHIDKPGYKIGVAIGYRINKNFSVEIGLQREHINFYSDGKYIDTSMLKIKSNTYIESVDASSKLTSVPLKLRYNFSSKSYNRFFVTAGVNAVLITHNEKYSYSVSKNGVEGSLSKNYSSLKSPKYFTGISTSAGYEKKLSKWCYIKVEPYYQTPISNFGIGKLSVSNFGVDLGIVKDLK